MNKTLLSSWTKVKVKLLPSRISHNQYNRRVSGIKSKYNSKSVSPWLLRRRKYLLHVFKTEMKSTWATVVADSILSWTKLEFSDQTQACSMNSKMDVHPQSKLYTVPKTHSNQCWVMIAPLSKFMASSITTSSTTWLLNSLGSEVISMRSKDRKRRRKKYNRYLRAK